MKAHKLQTNFAMMRAFELKYLNTSVCQIPFWNWQDLKNFASLFSISALRYAIVKWLCSTDFVV